MTLTEVEEILSLPTQERLRLLDVIWDSLEAEQAAKGLSMAERNLVEQRLEAYRKDPDDLLSWDEIQRRAFGG